MLSPMIRVVGSGSAADRRDGGDGGGRDRLAPGVSETDTGQSGLNRAGGFGSGEGTRWGVGGLAPNTATTSLQAWLVSGVELDEG